MENGSIANISVIVPFDQQFVTNEEVAPFSNRRLTKYGNNHRADQQA